MSAGPVEGTGFGPVGISPQRLESWIRLTGFALSPWQAEAVLRGSAAYAGQLNSESKSAPWVDPDTDKAAAARAIRAALRARG